MGVSESRDKLIEWVMNQNSRFTVISLADLVVWER